MKFAMRRSRVLEKIRAGGVALSFKVNSADTRVHEIAAYHGFDCLWIGMEHTANDWSVIERAVLAAKAYDVDLLCRVAKGSYSDVVRPLELDAAGIIIPHVMSADEAKQIVHTTRFHPIGRRPADGGNADGLYCNLPFTEYIEQANRERFTILQIEDPEALDVLDDIAAVEGYDMLFYGPGDMSHGMGIPGQTNDPRIVEGCERVAAAAKAHGKIAAGTCAPENLQKMIDLGYTFINVGADVIGFSNYCRDVAEQVGITKPNMPVGQ